MRNISKNLLNSTGKSGLYCVWLAVEDGGRGGLRTIWIDREMTVFTLDGTGTAATCLPGHQKEDLDLAAREYVPSIPSPRG